MIGIVLRVRAAAIFAVLFIASSALAQNQGFQLSRHEPTSAGEFSFGVDHPWYSSTRYFAGGLTLDYGHAPLVFGQQLRDGTFMRLDPVIAHQLISHVDLAGSFLDRVTLSLSLPVVLYESGTPQNGIEPLSGASVGDPRFGVMVRIWGQPDRSPFSISVGGQIWVPLRKFTDSLPQQESDQEVRGLPKLVLAGLSHRIRWSFTFGVLIRPDAIVGTPVLLDGSSTGTATQFGALLQYADVQRRFAVGPEALLSSVITGGHAFKPDYTSLEVLLGAHYNVAKQVQLGLAGGVGILREPGTPDGRLLFRVVYAPIRGPEKPRDVDHDGVLDRDDLCPQEPAGAHPDPQRLGCPLSDSDGDGVIDVEDLCPQKPAGANPDPQRLGCPLPDSDGDGVFDDQDRCPKEPAGPHPDPQRKGCPAADSDGDGVFDDEDQCPKEPAGSLPDPQRKGCPAPDRDGDRVPDAQDMCPDQPAGPNPDPKRPGCPLQDSDGDGIPDVQDLCPKVPAGPQPDTQRIGCPLPDQDADEIPDKIDACPRVPGIPDPDPKKNGCPGLVEIKHGFIEIKQQIYFKTARPELEEKRSLRILRAIVNLLQAKPEIKRVEVVGHSDDKGDSEPNRILSDNRAKSVMKWLVGHGVAAERLQAKGYGEVQLVEGISKRKQRQRNRRVEFQILDPPQPKAAVQAPQAPAAQPEPAAGDSKAKKRPHRKKKDDAAKDASAAPDKPTAAEKAEPAADKDEKAKKRSHRKKKDDAKDSSPAK